MRDALILSAQGFYSERRYERIINLLLAIKAGYHGEIAIKQIVELNDTEGNLIVTLRGEPDEEITDYIEGLWNYMYSEYSVKFQYIYEAR